MTPRVDAPWHVVLWDDGYSAGYAVERSPPTYPAIYFGGGDEGEQQAEELRELLNTLESKIEGRGSS